MSTQSDDDRISAIEGRLTQLETQIARNANGIVMNHMLLEEILERLSEPKEKQRDDLQSSGTETVQDFKEKAHRLKGKQFEEFSELDLGFLGEPHSTYKANSYRFIQTIGNGRKVETILITKAFNGEGGGVIVNVSVKEIPE